MSVTSSQRLAVITCYQPTPAGGTSLSGVKNALDSRFLRCRKNQTVVITWKLELSEGLLERGNRVAQDSGRD